AYREGSRTPSRRSQLSAHPTSESYLNLRHLLPVRRLLSLTSNRHRLFVARGQLIHLQCMIRAALNVVVSAYSLKTVCSQLLSKTRFFQKPIKTFRQCF